MFGFFTASKEYAVVNASDIANSKTWKLAWDGGTDEDDEKNLACVSIAGHPVYAGPLNPGDDFDFAAQAKLLGTRVPDSHEFSRRMRLLLSAVSMHSASTTSTTSTITRSPKTPSPIPTPMHSILNN